MAKRYSEKLTPPGPAPTRTEVVFGLHPVLESLRAGQEMDKILLQRELGSEATTELLATARSLGVPVQRVPIEKLNRVTRKNHQGVVAFLAAITYASLDHVVQTAYAEGRAPLVLILDRVTDVRNFGAIARSAECLGADALVVPDRGGAQINSDALKTSAGALQHLPVCREANLKQTIEFLQQNGLRVVACTEQAPDELATCDLTGPLALLMGSEEDGVSPEYLRRCDLTARIPMRGQIASLNVGVATGIALYEIVRQRGLD